jgi:hypothetical protein
MGIKKKWLSWEEFERIQGGTWAPPSHTHPRSEVSDFFGSPFWASIPDKPSTFTPSSHALVGAKHTASGLTVGHVIRATGATAFAWAQLQHSDLGGVTSDLHHPQAHTLASHSTKPHSALTGVTSDQHHPQAHTLASHSTKAHSELTGVTSDQHHSEVHTHVKADITNLPWAWTDISKTGSSLADLVTRPHSQLSDAPADAHHAKLHALDHQAGGTDGLSVDVPSNIGTTNQAGSQTNFVRRDHVHAHPSGLGANLHHSQAHTLGSHSTKAHSELTGVTSDQHHPQVHDHVKADITDTPWAWTDISKLGSNLTDLVTRSHSSLQSIGDDDHHAKLHAIGHQAGGADGLSVDVPSDIGTSNQAGSQTNFVRRDHVHKHPSGLGINLHHNKYHVASHHVGGDDLVNHDNLTGFVANEHINHGSVSMVAGSGLSGGGTIAASRTFNLGLLTANWDAGSYQIRAKTFYSDETVAPPFTVASYAKVTNLNADWLDDYHAAAAATGGTIVARTAAGYIYCTYLNCTSGETTSNPTHYFVEIGNDSFLRQMAPANFVAQLVSDGLVPKTGAIMTGAIVARDHGSAAVDEIVNVCYGTGSPPAANSTTIGTLWVKYT